LSLRRKEFDPVRRRRSASKLVFTTSTRLSRALPDLRRIQSKK
jgi:hypothetical protein